MCPFCGFYANENESEQKLSLSGKRPVRSILRFANYVLDILGFYILVFVISVSLSFLAALYYVKLYGPGFDASYEVTALNDAIFGGIHGRLNLLLMYFAYYLVLESLFGRTLGKVLTGTKVIMVDGSKPGFKNILKRSLSRFIPFEVFSLLGSGNPVGWHDSLSGTIVVKR